MVQTQFSTNIQILRSNKDGKFINKNFQKYSKFMAFFMRLCPQTPQQKNGVVERYNCHILENARSLLIGPMYHPPNGLRLLPRQFISSTICPLESYNLVLLCMT